MMRKSLKVLNDMNQNGIFVRGDYDGTELAILHGGYPSSVKLE